MNRKRSRLENMFPIEVHRTEEDQETSVEVVREVDEPQESTPRQGISFGEGKSHFIYYYFH